MKYKCECGESKELYKTTTIIKEGKVLTKEALCKCGKYMKTKTTKGMPTIIRNEPNLSKYDKDRAFKKK